MSLVAKQSLKLARVYVVVAFVAGVFFCKIGARWDSIAIETTLDPVAIAALLVTIVISAVFFRRFEKSKYSDQLKKDSVLLRLRESLDNLKRVDELVRRGRIPFSHMAQAIKRCRKEFGLCYKLAGLLGHPPADGKAGEYMRLCSRLLDMVTNTPVVPLPDPPVSVINGIIHLSDERVAETQNLVAEGKELILEMEARVISSV